MNLGVPPRCHGLAAISVPSREQRRGLPLSTLSPTGWGGQGLGFEYDHDTRGLGSFTTVLGGQYRRETRGALVSRRCLSKGAGPRCAPVPRGPEA